MASTYREAFFVAQPIEKVFSFATNIERRPQWQRHLRKATQLTDDQVGKGTQFEEDGISGKMVLQISEFETNKCMRYVTVEGRGIFADVNWAFSTYENGTSVTVQVSLSPLGFMKILWPLFYPIMIRPQVRKDFQYLKNAFQGLD
jgi:uncharacterized membrane protein